MSINIPQFKGTSLRQLEFNGPCDEGLSDTSNEHTDDETYQKIHKPREIIEEMVRWRPELRKIKANGRSVPGLKERCFEENLARSLEILSWYLDAGTIAEYVNEGIDLLPYPIPNAQDSLFIKWDKQSEP